jgi:hypothetical protein
MANGLYIIGQKAKEQDGQSLIEFLLMTPMMIGITMTLYWINNGIQIGIVNQKHARAEVFYAIQNSSTYPRRGLLEENLIPRGWNQMVVGVSDVTGQDGRILPVPSFQQIVSRGKDVGDDESTETPRLRGKPRIRTTVALCTQMNVIEVDGQWRPFHSRALQRASSFPFCRRAWDE